ncbi:FIST C-terminal domain-containing protein [Rhodoferax sp.]|uniref:FIST signal transduction protein n=1 Tax=Rhodoferax sp. TaxID=50421 RepID=UPI0028435D98|nr:FIST C-terminal domain-containing protein [Rhodoferax sp.]MDR3369343.1 FIST C-terminal domain-containing protein [Rhodoferax sp.]
MKLFPYAHATHPRWDMAVGLVLAQLRAQMTLHGYAANPTLALLYITDHYVAHAQDILEQLSSELPEVTDWTGTVGVGIASNNVEYFDEPALAVMLCELPTDQYRVFSGVAPLGLAFEAHTALVHADPHTAELSDLIVEMAARTDSGYLFGGLSSSRGASVQFAVAGDGNVKGQGAASGVFSGGLSGVAFGPGVNMVSRVTQGCLPVAKAHQVTAAEHNLVLALDGEPALEVLLRELDVTLDEPHEALQAVRATLAGLTERAGTAGGAGDAPTITRTGNFGSDVLVRHIIGLDPVRYGVAVASPVKEGMELAFCQRNVQAARADLMRVCAEIREELEPAEMALESASALAVSEAEAAPHPARGIAGAIYVSCSGRGGEHFGGPSAELQIIRRALGDVPLVGFFAGGEIARNHLYGYTGVLTVLT